MNAFMEPIKIASRSNHKLVSQVSKALQNHFNILEFFYYRIDSSGRYILFQANNRDILDLFEQSNLLIKYPLYCDIKYPRPSHEIMVHREDPFHPPEINRVLISAGLKLGIHLRTRTENALHEFGFHCNSSSNAQCRLIANHLPELRCFANWFLKQNETVISFLNENFIDLPSVIGPDFYKNRILEAHPFYQRRRSFLTVLGIEQDYDVSADEIDTLKLLMDGYSAAQIAKRLARSPRTIEHRIERIKDKLACFSRAELIQKTQELWGHGLLW